MAGVRWDGVLAYLIFWRQTMLWLGAGPVSWRGEDGNITATRILVAGVGGQDLHPHAGGRTRGGEEQHNQEEEIRVFGR